MDHRRIGRQRRRRAGLAVARYRAIDEVGLDLFAARRSRGRSGASPPAGNSRRRHRRWRRAGAPPRPRAAISGRGRCSSCRRSAGQSWCWRRRASGGRVRIISPSGASILITSAPRSASIRPQCGPAIVVVKSSTRSPSKALFIPLSPPRARSGRVGAAAQMSSRDATFDVRLACGGLRRQQSRRLLRALPSELPA